jgi:hypothetical protein
VMGRYLAVTSRDSDVGTLSEEEAKMGNKLLDPHSLQQYT